MSIRTYIRPIAIGLAAATSLSLAACGSSKNNYSMTTNDVAAAKISMKNEPESPYWLPNDLLKWTPKSDPDLAYNVSTVPLSKRIGPDKIASSNKTQSDKTKLMALSIMNSGTSGNAPHGSNNASANTFTYWQYVDELVYWGGSAGEGIIVPPSPDVTDEGHRNGVPVIGTIFFPQDEAGGKIQWVRTLLKKKGDGSFPMADKLIEVAKTYKFDGWFINQETEGADSGGLNAEDAAAMQEFIQYFKSKAAGLRVIYYDAMMNDGSVDWQNALTDKNSMFLKDAKGKAVADDMFLNFGWNNKDPKSQNLLAESVRKAKKLGIDPTSLYAGVDVQANGIYTPVNWSLFADKQGKAYTSLGLYCPNWAFSEAESLDQFHDNEASLWVNADHDPTAKHGNGTQSKWPGVSTYVKEKSVISKLPFVTNFNTGSGYHFYRDGNEISTMNWNNRSVADLLPTYQWNVVNGKGNTLQAAYDYKSAWYGGNSVRLAGTVSKDAQSVANLYATALTLPKSTSLSVKAKASSKTDLVAKLTFSDGSTADVKGSSSVNSDWTTVKFDVKKFAGKVLSKLGLGVSSNEDASGYEFHLGNVTMIDGNAAKSGTVQDVKVDKTVFDDSQMYTGAQLSWKSEGDPADYEIYRVGKDKSLGFLGISNTTNFFVNTMKRDDGVNETKFMIVPVNSQGTQGKGATATMTWPDNSKPKAGMKVSRTLIAPGQQVTFSSDSSANTKSVAWTLPGSDKKAASGKSVKATYKKEGVYNVTVTARNDSGGNKKTYKSVIVVSSKISTGELPNLSQGASATASAFTNAKEAPQFAIDGDLKTKWCANTKAPYDLVIDLGKDETVGQVDIAHAHAGGEDASMNTKKYTISVSSDGVKYTTVKEVKKTIVLTRLRTLSHRSTHGMSN